LLVFSQDNLSSAIDDKYMKLKSLEQHIQSERTKLDQQQKEFMEGVMNNEMALRTATSSCQRMKRECEEMKARLEVADRTINDVSHISSFKILNQGLHVY
jgi:hypothetical protein